MHLIAAEETHGAANDGVIGWLNLGYAHPNPGKSIGPITDKMARDAVIAADPYVNYAGFDTNGDHIISLNELHIVVIVAGYDVSYGNGAACSPNLWAYHSSADAARHETSRGWRERHRPGRRLPGDGRMAL